MVPILAVQGHLQASYLDHAFKSLRLKKVVPSPTIFGFRDGNKVAACVALSVVFSMSSEYSKARMPSCM